MRFSHKLGKLFSGDALRSIRGHTHRLLRECVHPPLRSSAAIIRQIEARGFDEVRRRYASLSAPADSWPKYLNLSQWIPINLQRVRALQLDQVRPLRVLDLGCGAGYFLYICKLLGHMVLGLDIDAVPMFRDTTTLLQVPRVIARVRPRTPLPKLPHLFDVITAHSICFNNHKTEQLWGIEEWDYFLKDVATRLTPNGRLQLELNREAGGEPYSPALRRYFESCGAIVNGFRVGFTPGQLQQYVIASAAAQTRSAVADVPRSPAPEHVR